MCSLICIDISLLFVKTLASISQGTTGKRPMEATNSVIYDEPISRGPFGWIITKDNLKLQPNPSYDLSHKMIEDTNPAFK